MFFINNKKPPIKVDFFGGAYGNMPPQPLHTNCHCTKELIASVVAKGKCILGKFTNYIFDDDKNGGKKDLFESWGYDIIDSIELQKEFIKQAQYKYENGDFILGKLDCFGQRINIEILLPRKNKGGTVKFFSGWMVYPNGEIALTTPYEVKYERIKLR